MFFTLCEMCEVKRFSMILPNRDIRQGKLLLKEFTSKKSNGTIRQCKKLLNQFTSVNMY